MKSLAHSLLLFCGVGLMLISTHLGNPMDIPPYYLLFTGLLLLPLCWNGRIDWAFYVVFPLNILFLLIGGPAQLTSFLSVVLAWGFANQVNTFKTAAIQYPLFLILLLFLPREPINTLLAAGLNLVPLGVLFVLPREGEEVPRAAWGYWVAFGLIIFAVNAMVLNSGEVLKEQLKVSYPDPITYSTAMGALAGIKNPLILGVSSVGLLFGGLLSFFGRRLLPFFGAALILVMTYELAIIFFSPAQTPVGEGGMVASMRGYAALGTTFALFSVMIKELLYFGFDLKNRLTAKLLFDVVVYSVAILLSKGLFLNEKGMIFCFIVVTITAFYTLFKRISLHTF